MVTKVGFNCTIPLVGQVDVDSYKAATVSEPFQVNGSGGKQLSDEEIAKETEAMIREKPRNWSEIVQHFGDQNYRAVYRAFGQLRPKLGRIADQRPQYPYTFADEDFVSSKK